MMMKTAQKQKTPSFALTTTMPLQTDKKEKKKKDPNARPKKDPNARPTKAQTGWVVFTGVLRKQFQALFNESWETGVAAFQHVDEETIRSVGSWQKAFFKEASVIWHEMDKEKQDEYTRRGQRRLEKEQRKWDEANPNPPSAADAADVIDCDETEEEEGEGETEEEEEVSDSEQQQMDVVQQAATQAQANAQGKNMHGQPKAAAPAKAPPPPHLLQSTAAAAPAPTAAAAPAAAAPADKPKKKRKLPASMDASSQSQSQSQQSQQPQPQKKPATTLPTAAGDNGKASTKLAAAKPPLKPAAGSSSSQEPECALLDVSKMTEVGYPYRNETGELLGFQFNNKLLLLNGEVGFPYRDETGELLGFIVNNMLYNLNGKVVPLQ